MNRRQALQTIAGITLGGQTAICPAKPAKAASMVTWRPPLRVIYGSCRTGKTFLGAVETARIYGID